MTGMSVRCQRCQRRAEGDLQGWNGTVSGGRVVAVLCPDCQTPEENAEAAIKEATLDYGTDEQDRLVAWPKGTRR